MIALIALAALAAGFPTRGWECPPVAIAADSRDDVVKRIESRLTKRCAAVKTFYSPWSPLDDANGMGAPYLVDVKVLARSRETSVTASVIEVSTGRVQGTVSETRLIGTGNFSDAAQSALGIAIAERVPPPPPPPAAPSGPSPAQRMAMEDQAALTAAHNASREAARAAAQTHEISCSTPTRVATVVENSSSSLQVYWSLIAALQERCVQPVPPASTSDLFASAESLGARYVLEVKLAGEKMNDTPLTSSKAQFAHSVGVRLRAVTGHHILTELHETGAILGTSLAESGASFAKTHQKLAEALADGVAAALDAQPSPPSSSMSVALLSDGSGADSELPAAFGADLERAGFRTIRFASDEPIATLRAAGVRYVIRAQFSVRESDSQGSPMLGNMTSYGMGIHARMSTLSGVDVVKDASQTWQALGTGRLNAVRQLAPSVPATRKLAEHLAHTVAIYEGAATGPDCNGAPTKRLAFLVEGDDYPRAEASELFAALQKQCIVMVGPAPAKDPFAFAKENGVTHLVRVRLTTSDATSPELGSMRSYSVGVVARLSYVATREVVGDIADSDSMLGTSLENALQSPTPKRPQGTVFDRVATRLAAAFKDDVAVR